MSKPECQSELDWSAFCYAAGEMSPAEATAFEDRLADSQPAREALARAVELAGAVAAAETLEPVVLAGAGPVYLGRSLWGRRLTWMAVGAAASLLVAAVISGPLSGLSSVSGLFRGRANSPLAEREDHKSAARSRELAAAWSQTRQELAVASDAGLWFPDHLDAVGPETSDLSADDSDDATLAATPSWLTAAVLSAAGLPVDGDVTPFDGESRDN